VAVFRVSKKLKPCAIPWVMPEGASKPRAPGVELGVALGVLVLLGVSVLVGVSVELNVGVALQVGVSVDVKVGLTVEV